MKENDDASGQWIEPAFASSPTGMAIFDDELRFVAINGSLAAINGVSSELTLGRRPSEVIGPVGNDVERMLRQVLETGESIVDVQFAGVVPRAPTRRQTWRASYFPVRDEGRIVAVGMVTSLPERNYLLGAGNLDERYRLLVEGAHDYAIFTLDPQGRVATWNAGAEQVLGWDAGEAMGLPYSRLFTGEDAGDGLPDELLASAVREGYTEYSGWRTRQDGTRLWAHGVVTALKRADDGALLGFTTVVRDLTEQRAVANTLQASQAHLRSIVQSAPDAVLVVDNRGVIVSTNERGEQMFGYRADEMVGRSIEMLLPDHLRSVHLRYRAGFLDDPHTRSMGSGLDLVAQRRDGSRFPVEVGLGAARSGSGGDLITAVVTDISRRKQAEEEIARLGTHDPLTGLANRVLCRDRLHLAVSALQRSDGAVGVLFLDLDGFKAVNDSLGHAAGDELLQLVAERLLDVSRPNDTVARFGGDEFALILDDLRGPGFAATVARRLLRVLSRPFPLPSGDIQVSASIGVAVATGGEDTEELLRNADAAMYHAKERGRNRYELFDAELRAEVRARIEVERGLRRSLEDEEFDLVFQPLVRLHDGTLAGAEALVRWSPAGTPLPAADFIQVAEETGLVTELGRWVLRETCVRGSGWTDDVGEPLPLSLNVSLHELRADGFAESLDTALREGALDPSRLSLEVSTAVLVDASALRGLRTVRERGVQVMLDHFGSHPLPLEQLGDLPVRAVKISQRFVRRLDEGDAAPVTGLIGLARAYSLTTIGLGVETPRQAAQLTALGCDMVQGYLYGAPRDAASFPAVFPAGVEVVARAGSA